MAQDDFLEKMHALFGDKYDFSKFVYDGYDRKGIVVCKEHGEFMKSPHDLSKGFGCPKCSIENASKKRTWSKDKFIEEARKIHGDKYDYSKVEYVKQSDNVIITCPIHGDFEQTPRKHLMGSGCKECGREKASISQSLGSDEFIRRSKEKYGDKFDYSNVRYVNRNSLVKISCPIHGEFDITPINHLKSSCGCTKCSIEHFNDKNRKDKEYFIKQAISVHGNKYSYDNFKYVNWHTKGCVTCQIHGDFLVTPSNHVGNMSGCPKCMTPISKWEQDVVNTIRSLGIEAEQSNRTVLNGKEIDIFLPKYNIGIECDGLRWHNELYKDKNYHLDKTNKCNEANVRLIHIFEDEWAFKKDIWLSMLKNILGLTDKKIYARNCKLKMVNSSDSREFLNNNHIQGYATSLINIGLYYNDELVSLMTFGKPRINLGGNKCDGSYELVRFVNKLGYLVIGGASKLFKYFINEYKPNDIISYSDKRWSLGNLYNVLGFEHIHDSRPNYYYVNELTRENRFKYRKSVLVNEGYDPSKTEHEIMLERGIYRIYDCGTMVFKMKMRQD